MYKIPQQFDPLILKHQIINQISFGINFVTFFFGKGFIQFSGGFTYDILGNSNTYSEVYPVQNDFGLLKILEKSILDVMINEDRDEFSIIFENDCKVILTSNEYYESFIININGNEFRV